MLVICIAVNICAALLASAAGVLVIAGFFIADRAPPSAEMLGIHLAVGVLFLGMGTLLFGIQRHVGSIAALTHGLQGKTGGELARHVGRLLAYLLAGGVFLCAVFGLMTYAILERIGQGFAVFG